MFCDTTANESNKADPWCEGCARIEFAKRLGEGSVLAETIESLVTRLSDGLTADEIRQAVEDALNGREVLFGARQSEYEWCKTHDDGLARTHKAHLSQFVPIATIEGSDG